MKELFFAISLSFLAITFFQCKCDEDTTPADCVCIEIYSPVCGDDGVVYENYCFAECAGVGYTEGFCPETKDGVVRDLGDPALDGCGWVIEFVFSDTVVNYRPDTLAETFKVDGLKVNVEFIRTLEQSACGLIETIPIMQVLSMTEK
jgi:hypothetical protein